MAIYPGNPEVKFEQVAPASSSSSALTKITLGSHTGTHIDAPSHIELGGAGAGRYTLEGMNGPAEVIQILTAQRVIGAADLPSTKQPRVLIKTTNSDGNVDVFDPDFVALAEDAAEELVKRNISLVGIDAPSIKKKGVKDKVHEIFLNAGIVILEGLWLVDVHAGQYELLCLPLPVDLDGAPVRSVLFLPNR